MQDRSGFGAKCRALRKERKLTQAVLAELAGLSLSAISKAERGLRAPSGYTIVRLAHALGVESGELMSGLMDNQSVDDLGKTGSIRRKRGVDIDHD